MAIERLPEAVRTPSVARVAVSPSAVVATGAGVAVGLVAGLPVLATLALGAGFWGIRVGVAAAMARRRRRRLAQPEEIDPYAVPEPWRGFVREALTAQARFDQAVTRCRPGPLQDHLREVGRRMSDGVAETWRVAQLGASISAAVGSVDPAATSRQLRRIQEQRRLGRRPGTALGASSPASEAIDVTEAALATRLQAARRMEGVVQRTTDRLQVLTATLDEAVASAVELALDAGDPMATAPIAGQVDSVVGEIQTLRQAMEESNSAPMTGTVQTP